MQSSRGTSLTGADSVPADPTASGAPFRAAPLLLGTAGAVLLADQLTKYLAVRELSDRLPVELFGGLLTLRLVRNPGAAFGLASEMTIVFPIIAVVVCVLIVRATPRLRSLGWTIGLALLLGGASGNLVDRLVRPPAVLQGHVVDFLELPNWPVFNVADMAIVTAALVLGILSASGRQLDGTSASDARPRPSGRAPIEPPADV